MQLTKRFYNHKGVDLKSSDLIRPQEFASNMLNAQYTDGGGLEKRVGYQGHAASAGGFGQWTYQRYNPVTGVSDPRVVAVGDNLSELRTSTLSITYSGGNATCFLACVLDSTTGVYRFQITEGATLLLNQSLGVGFDEASPFTLTDLVAAVNALTGFAATVTAGSTPAAFLQVVREFDLTTVAYLGTAKYWGTVYSPVSNPLSSYYANRNNSNHENVSSVQISNVIYFGSGFNDLYKYDGQTFYRAGLPTPNSLSSSKSAGAITGSNYVHRVQYSQVDAAGNIIESNLLSFTSGSAAAERFTLTIANIVAGTGFNTNGATVNGLQTGVNTITVTAAHTLQVGDTAYFFNGVSSSHVAREITARTNTTITIAGAAVNVAASIPISNNLRILVWRSKSSAVTPSLFFLVGEIPNDSATATQTLIDNTTDASLGELLTPPSTDRSIPPKGKYISQWNGQMLVGGILDNPTSLQWSDTDGPEYFPNNTNQLFIEPGNGDVIVGLAPNNEVFTVHGDVSFTVITGELATGQIRVETRARDVGCVAHASIVDSDGVLVWLSAQGPRQSTGGQVPSPLGPANDAAESNQASRLDPAFNNAGKVKSEQLQLKRAVGFSDSSNDKILFFVPAETTTGGQVFANASSRLFVYDKIRDAWLIWSNINAAGGFTYLGSDMYFIERRYSAFASSVSSIMYRRHALVDAYDYADNTVSVDFDYSPQWEALGEPSVLKDAISIRVFSLESVANNQFTLTVEQEVNYQSDSSAATFTIALTGGGYGNSGYGVDAYGDPIQDGYLHPLFRTRLRSIRPRFKNATIHENVLVTGWELEFSTPFRPEFKS